MKIFIIKFLKKVYKHAYNDDTNTVRAPSQLVVSLAMMLNPSVHSHCMFLALNLSIRTGLSVQVIL